MGLDLIAVAAVVTILVGVIAALKWGKSVFRWIWHRLTRYAPRVPRETIRILPQIRSHWWHMGSISGQPAMQIVGDWYVTNITADTVVLLGARIIRPRKLRVDGDVFVQGRSIPPGSTEEVRVQFWVQPPVYKEEEDFQATVVITDQFGNDHKAKKVVFKTPISREPKKPKPPKESLYAIGDPLVKDIAAVLKDEVEKYRQHGRREGGLGSVQTVYRGRTLRGVPTWQGIIPDPETASVESDNARALVKLYEKLGTESKRTQFRTALLRRLSRETEYVSVGYLIVLVLFRLGMLPGALSIAKRDLQKDEAYGFSEVLRLLDGLLNLEHPAFTPELLDEIERFIEGIEEPIFGIRERIAAIRAYRLVSRTETRQNS